MRVKKNQVWDDTQFDSTLTRSNRLQSSGSLEIGKIVRFPQTECQRLSLKNDVIDHTTV